MSYVFLLEMGAEYSVECYVDMLQYAPWKSTQDVGEHYYNASAMGFCLGSPFGMILKPSMEGLGKESPKLSVEDFLAPEYHQPELITTSAECSEDLMMLALDCGMRWKESLAKCNLNLLLLKTPRIYALKDLSPSSKVLTAWGMTQSGVCLDVAISAQTISEPECSLLPTPTRHNAKEGAYPAEYTRNTPTLAAQIGGKINPRWNEHRMGWPQGWADSLKPLEMDKCPLSLGSPGKHYLGSFNHWAESHGLELCKLQK